MIQNNLCPLCKNTSKIFYHFKNRLYHQCDNCLGIFVDQSLILYGKNEKARYNEHNNDVDDKRFQKFVSPITSIVRRDFTKEDKGLDFGAGNAPVITKVLTDNNYDIKPYDPFFHNNVDLLKKTYNYITSCEVVEHFHNPLKEFKLLKSLLNPNGKLYIMTWLYSEGINFHNWNYKDDHTHIFIYHKNSFEWIKENVGYKDVQFHERLIVFSR